MIYTRKNSRERRRKDEKRISTSIPQDTNSSLVTRKIVTVIYVTNNRTGDVIEYYNEPENLCGLDWGYSGGFLSIRQSKSFGNKYWIALGVFSEHSVSYLKWEDVVVPLNQSEIEDDLLENVTTLHW